MSTLAEDTIDRPLSGVRPPTALSNCTSPAPAVIVSSWSPSSTSLNHSLPPAVPMATSPVKLTPAVNVTASPLVLMSPAVETRPTPSCRKAPSRVRSARSAIVSRPPLVIVTVPP